MKKVILCLLAMGIFSFSGCSYKTEIINYSDLPGPGNEDYSTVSMFRESKLYGSTRASPIQVNGVSLFRIGNGDCVTFKIPTGPSEITYSPEWKRVKFLSEKGKKYYFYLRVEPGNFTSEFRQLTEEEWNSKQKACKWVQLKKD